MYIKYGNNIHNLDNYYSVNEYKSGENNAIHLYKKDGNFIALTFKNTEARDYILSKIWEKIGVEEKFDIEVEVELFYKTKKYNL